MSQTFLYILLGVICSFVLSAGCPSGWRQHSNKCYFLSNEITTFNHAGGICSSYGGKLAEPLTSGENSFIIQQLHAQSGDYFIGVTDIFTQDSWKYLSSMQSVSSSVQKWLPGEPNNYQGHLEDCVFIRGGENGWLDGQCSTNMKFVCEKPQ